MAYTQFFRITGAFIVGVISLVVAIVILALFFPLLMAFFAAVFPFIAGALLILAAVVVLWLLVYFFAMIGVGIYYAIRKPMEVNRAGSASYGVSGVSEAGLREKGRSRKAAKIRKKPAPARKRAAKRKPRRKR
ncbi:MAG: hypothetical protein V1813_01645 [Candidatus Aenigmatarchaeota archaeon]